MRGPAGVALFICALMLAGGAISAAENDAPAWAYAINPEREPPVPSDNVTLYTLPGNDRSFTRDQLRGRSADDPDVRAAPADWYPEDHPPTPDFVADPDSEHGTIACTLCHYHNGKGRPESSSLAGLPEAYMVRQMREMRDGLRTSADPRKRNTQLMIDAVKALTDEEVVQSARYYASMAWTPWIRVVETETVPKTYIRGFMFLPIEGDGAGTEPIGNRIIEMPEDVERSDVLRDPRSGFIAYVPVGAVARGEELVRSGGGRTIACALCHGEDLNGLGEVPGIAARSPSYLARQLYDFKEGSRHGTMAALMMPVVASLSSEDILDIVAYTASLPAP